jgi:DNA mismatch repair protein MutL
MFFFVNGRLIRDRLIQHALTEAYRNILPPTVFPVVLLFIEMPPTEVDCNVHPAKTEVRFRQQSLVHDFVRDSVRAALIKARPVPQFTREIAAQPTAGQALTPGAAAMAAGESGPGFALSAPPQPVKNERLDFATEAAIDVPANAAIATAQFTNGTGQFATGGPQFAIPDTCGNVLDEHDVPADLTSLASLKALGQIRESFILAVNQDGLWIIDQHVAHERVLFEKTLKQRDLERLQGQRLLMPIVVELTPGQQAIFAEIADELRANGFDVEPFGSRTIAIKAAPAGVNASDIEKMLHELLDQLEREEQSENLDRARHRIAASIACHAAIKVNMPLEQQKMDWLLQELAKTECPMTCPHGRPVVLRYSLKDIQRAFKRI